MKKGQTNKSIKKLNIKKASLGASIATGAIVTGVVLSEELRKHDQPENENNSGDFGIAGGSKFANSPTPSQLQNRVDTA